MFGIIRFAQSSVHFLATITRIIVDVVISNHIWIQMTECLTS